jgi:hypothetical protein
MKCPKCLQTIPSSAIKCRCGYDLKKASGPFSALQKNWEEQLKNTWIIVIGVLWGVIDMIVKMYRGSEPKLNMMPLLVICVPLAVFTGRKIYGYLYRKNAVMNWPATIGKIIVTLVDIGNAKRQGLYSYVPKVVYEYSVSGVTYRNNKISRSVPTFRTRGNAKKYADRFKEGTEVTVFYNPRKPWDAVLEKN